MGNDERFERLLRECNELAARRFAEVWPDEGADPDGADYALVAALRALPRVEPRPEFRAAARARLLDRITSAPPARRSHPLPRLALRLAAGVALVSGLASGAIAASAGSLPDEPLYAVKAAIEGMQLRTALTAEDRVALHLAFAARRLAELEAASESRPAAAEAATERYERELRAAAQVLREEPRLSREPVVERVEDQLRQHNAALHDVLLRAPARVKPVVEQALDVSRQSLEYVERAKSGENKTPLAPDPPVPVSALPSTPAVATQSPVAPPAMAAAPAAGHRPLAGDVGEVRPADGAPRSTSPQKAKPAQPAGPGAKLQPPIAGQPPHTVVALPSTESERAPTAAVGAEEPAAVGSDPPVVAAEQRGASGTPATTPVRPTPLPAAPTAPSPPPAPSVVVPPLPLAPPTPAPRAQSQSVVVASGSAAVGNPLPEWRRAEEVPEQHPQASQPAPPRP